MIYAGRQIDGDGKGPEVAGNGSNSSMDTGCFSGVMKSLEIRGRWLLYNTVCAAMPLNCTLQSGSLHVK